MIFTPQLTVKHVNFKIQRPPLYSKRGNVYTSCFAHVVNVIFHTSQWVHNSHKSDSTKRKHLHGLPKLFPTFQAAKNFGPKHIYGVAHPTCTSLRGFFVLPMTGHHSQPNNHIMFLLLLYCSGTHKRQEIKSISKQRRNPNIFKPHPSKKTMTHSWKSQ